MKSILFLLFAFPLSSVNAQTVSPDSAKFHEGTLITVCGEVTSGRISETNNVFLNFGERYPDNCFTAVIFANDSAKFEEIKPAQYLKHKYICVKGKVVINNGKAEIIVKSPDQIRFTDAVK